MSLPPFLDPFLSPLSVLSTCFLISVAFFLPILRWLDNAGDDIMLQFVKIPPQVRRVLYETAATRFRVLRRDHGDEEDSDSGDEAEDVGDADAEKAALNPVVKPDGGEGMSVIDEDGVAGDSTLARAFGGASVFSEGASDAGSVDGHGDDGHGGADSGSAAVAAAVKRSRPLRRTSEKLSYRKPPLAFATLLSRFLSPLLLLVVLFSVVYGTYIQQAARTKSLVSLVVAAGLRASCGRQALVDLQKLEYLTTDAAYIWRSFFFVMASLDCVRSNTRLLAFGTVDKNLEGKTYVPYVGTPENGAGSYLSAATTATAYNVMFGNACPFLQAASANPSAFNMTKCLAFGNGVLQLGLAATIDLWWQYGYLMGDRQLRGCFLVGSLQEARGWFTPVPDFNYSLVVCEEKLGCAPYAVVSPLRSGALNPTWVSDPSYIGDYWAGSVPGDGIIGPTGGSVPADSYPYWSGNELNRPEMDFINEADALYVTPGLLALAQLYADDAKASISAFIILVAYFIPFFMAAFVLVILLVRARACAALNKPRARLLLTSLARAPRSTSSPRRSARTSACRPSARCCSTSPSTSSRECAPSASSSRTLSTPRREASPSRQRAAPAVGRRAAAASARGRPMS